MGSTLHRAEAEEGPSPSAPPSDPSNAKRRVYENVHVKPAAGGWQIFFDKTELKTQARNEFIVPTLPLALAIASEWEKQTTRLVQTFTMPMMAIAAVAVDQPKAGPDVINTLCRFVDTDAVCCRDLPGPLSELQEEVYAPVVDWANREMGIRLHITDDLFDARQTDRSLQGIRNYLSRLTPWELAAVENLSASCHSVLIGLAAFRNVLSVDESMQAARLEVDWQIGKWGLVEGGHDIDIADMRARMLAGHLFSRLLREE